jgi:voltage-gated potassium channel
LSLARIATTLNRSTRALSEFFRTNRFGYVMALTVAMVLTAAAGAYFFERQGDDRTLTSFPEALWWSATIVTTINAQSEPGTLEGRLIAIGLRVYGVAVIGYITATIAVFLLGGKARAGEADGQAEELRALRGEVRALRASLEGRRPERPEEHPPLRLRERRGTVR